MLVRLIDLKGQTFNLTFEEDVTVQAISQKLLKEYNFDSSRCYFCRSGKILKNEKISKEALAQGASDIPIIIFDSKTFPDKSFPKVDNAFQWSLSRYDDRFSMSRSKMQNRIDLSEDDFAAQVEHLLNQGIIPPTGIFSRILNMARLHNNQNTVDIQSGSDDEDEAEPNSNRNSNQPTISGPYGIDDFPPGTYFVGSNPNDDFQPFFLPPEVMDRTFNPPEREFMFNAFNPDLEQQEEEQQFEQQNEPIPEQLDDQPQEQLINQQLLEEQNHNHIDGIPIPALEDDDEFPGNGIPFTFNFGRRQDDLNQQIIEGLNLNITLSQADNQAISRLARAGYDRATVIQVYEACDRNEEAAMNLLVSMG